MAGGIAGYEAGGWKGAALGGVVGFGVGAVAEPVSSLAAREVIAWTGSKAAGVLAGAFSFSAINGFAGAAVEGAMKGATWRNLVEGFGVGFGSSFLSGEATLTGLGAAKMINVGRTIGGFFSARSGAFAVIWGLFGGTSIEAAQSPTSSPSEAPPSPTNPPAEPPGQPSGPEASAPCPPGPHIIVIPPPAPPPPPLLDDAPVPGVPGFLPGPALTS